MSVLIQNGQIVTSTKTYVADIRLEGELIVEIGKLTVRNDEQVIDASGCFILPGGIDPHTHFDLDVGATVTADDFYSGTKAAIMGGTTTILDYATQNHGETLGLALHNQFEKVKKGCFCDYGFHMGITDWNDLTSQDMETLVKQGVTSFKLYMAYKNTLQVDDDVIYRALMRSKALHALIGFHCENGDLIAELVQKERQSGHYLPKYHAISRPDSLEAEAIFRVLTISDLVKTPIYIVHLSSKKGLETILFKKEQGSQVYVETCPQYLLLEETCYDREDGLKFVMSPPLRKKVDQEALWEGLRKGEIQTIGTDHCSFNYKGQKELGKDDFSRTPNGAGSVENRLGLIYTYGVLEQRLTLNQWVGVTSTHAAKRFGLYPRKGEIEVGSDADLVIYEPHGKHTLQASLQIQNVDYSLYEGFNQIGFVKDVFLRGQWIVKNRQLNESIPRGSYIPRNSSIGGEEDV